MWLQVARLLAELVHEPSHGASWRRSMPDGSVTALTTPATSHAAFNKIAMQLIALTTAGMLNPPSLSCRADFYCSKLSGLLHGLINSQMTQAW